MTVDYEGGWYEEPEEVPECPDVGHVYETDVPVCETCGEES